MAARDLFSIFVCLMSSLVIKAALAAPVLPLSDAFLETQDLVLSDSDVRDQDIPKLVQLSSYPLQDPNEKAPYEDLPRERWADNFIGAYDRNLIQLLQKLSFATFSRRGGIRNENGVPFVQQEKNGLRTSKRGRDHMYGAMPPMLELCRAMHVDC